jgi:hypothetical protein
VGVQQAAGGAGLDDHDAQVVGDHIMQLAGDPGPLGRHRPLRLKLAVALGPLGPGGQLGGVGAPDPHIAAPGPHGAEEEHQVQQPDPVGIAPVDADAAQPLGGQQHQDRHAGQQRGPLVALGSDREQGDRQAEVELAGGEGDRVVGGVGGQHHREYQQRTSASPGQG